MNCNHASAEIELYLDGELSAMDSERLAGHFRNCTECRRLLEDERSFRQVLKEKIDWKQVPSSIRKGVKEVVMLQAV